MCHLLAVGISFFFILLAELRADTGGIFAFVMTKNKFLNEQKHLLGNFPS